MTDPVLDDVNKRIIEQLQRDGRMSYAALAKVVGLSEAAVRQRVQRLLDNGVMQIVAVTDPLTLGFTRQVMIGVKVTGDLRTVADALAAVPEIDYVVMCAGGYDLLAEMVCIDDEHLLKLLNDTIRMIPGVTSTRSSIDIVSSIEMVSSVSTSTVVARNGSAIDGSVSSNCSYVRSVPYHPSSSKPQSQIVYGSGS